MRKITVIFIGMQLLDLTTTAAGILTGKAAEVNPLAAYGWGWLLLAKLAAILFVAWALERKRPNKWDAVIPLAAGVIVPWNIINILMV